MSPWQHNRRDPPIKLDLLLKPSKGHHIHNNLGLSIGENIPQSQFVGFCEMNTLQSMEIRPTCNNISVYMSVHWQWLNSIYSCTCSVIQPTLRCSRRFVRSCDACSLCSRTEANESQHSLKYPRLQVLLSQPELRVEKFVEIVLPLKECYFTESVSQRDWCLRAQKRSR